MVKGKKSMPANNSFQLQSHKNHHQMNITLRYAIFSPHFSVSSFHHRYVLLFFHASDLPLQLFPHSKASDIEKISYAAPQILNVALWKRRRRRKKGWISVYIEVLWVAFIYTFTENIHWEHHRVVDFRVILKKRWITLNDLLLQWSGGNCESKLN
jgi:hypothetical protein